MNTITDKITRRIRAKKRGWVFTPKDFLDMGTRAAVDQVLFRLVSRGLIRRLDRGVYDFPKQHDVLGTLSPDAGSLAQAITAQTGDTAFPSGATAANLLGLSTQVPARPVYLTNGRSRVKKIAGRTITLQHARVPLLDHLPGKVNLMLQALSYIGKSRIDNDVITHCARRLDDKDLKALGSAAAQIPGWLADTVQKIRQAKHGQLHSTARQ